MTLPALTATEATECPPIPFPLPPSAGANWPVRIRELATAFAGRAANHDAKDCFVSENFADLKAARLLSAGVPATFGGGDCSYRELCEIVQILGRACGSTALALSMHFHQVAALVWRHRHQRAPVEGLLGRLVREQLVLVSSGGSDWLESSGTAEAVEGGYRVNARKAFASACPAGDLLLTSAVLADPAHGATVLHFPIEMKAPEVRINTNWQSMGMRGTGSHDVLIENAFVPSAAVSARRPRGRWHPSLHLASKVALPLIYSAYLGLAETARDLALRQARSRRITPGGQLVAGEMENELFAARLAHARMVEMGWEWPPCVETTNAMLMARNLVAESCVRAVEKAMELAGGRAFHRGFGLERVYRDVLAARFHPLPEKQQQEFAGRVALELSLDAP